MQEKESSRDSAYGYSADSRIPTREPTPDQRMLASHNRRILANLKSNRGSQLQKSKSDEDLKKQNAEYNKKRSHLKFLTDVTNDIITRGIYSERGLRSAINSQVMKYSGLHKLKHVIQVKKKEYEISSLDIENLMRQLKLELGIEQDIQKKIKSRSANLTRDTLSDLLTSGPGKDKLNQGSGKPLYPPAPPHRQRMIHQSTL